MFKSRNWGNTLGLCPTPSVMIIYILSFVTAVFRPVQDGFELISVSAMHKLPDDGAVSHCHFCAQTLALSVDVKCIYLYEASKEVVLEAAS